MWASEVWCGGGGGPPRDWPLVAIHSCSPTEPPPILGPHQSMRHQDYGVVWDKGCGLRMGWLFVLLGRKKGKRLCPRAGPVLWGGVEALGQSHCLGSHLACDTQLDLVVLGLAKAGGGVGWGGR